MATVRIYAKVCTSLFSQNAVYSTAAAGPAVGVWNSVSALNGQRLQSSVYTCLIGYMSFDTAMLASLGTITSATFNTNNLDDNSATDFTSNVRLHDFGTTLTNSDWLTPATMTTKTLLATYNTSGGNVGLKTWTSVALAANINTSGDTRFVVSSSRFESGSAPTGTEIFGPISYNSYLEITYTPNPSSPVVLITPTENDMGVITSNSFTYSNARSGESLSVATGNSNSNTYIGQNAYYDKSGPIYYVIQTFVRFDTSILASATSITSATLKIYPEYGFSDTDFDIQARLTTWSPVLQTTDFVPGANLSSKTLLAHLNTSGLAVGTYISLVSDALSTNLNLSGYTGIVFTSNKVVSGVAPVGSESIYTKNFVQGFSFKLEVVATFAVAPATYSTRMMGFIGS